MSLFPLTVVAEIAFLRAWDSQSQAYRCFISYRAQG